MNCTCNHPINIETNEIGDKIACQGCGIKFTLKQDMLTKQTTTKEENLKEVSVET